MNITTSFLSHTKNKLGVLVVLFMAAFIRCNAATAISNAQKNNDLATAFKQKYPMLSTEKEMKNQLNDLEKEISKKEKQRMLTPSEYISGAEAIVKLHLSRIRTLLRGNIQKSNNVLNSFHTTNKQYCQSLFPAGETTPQLMIKRIYANLTADAQKEFMQNLDLQKNLLAVFVRNDPDKQSEELKKRFMQLEALSWQNQFAVIISYYTSLAPYTAKAEQISSLYSMKAWIKDIENNLKDISSWVIVKEEAPANTKALHNIDDKQAPKKTGTEENSPKNGNKKVNTTLSSKINEIDAQQPDPPSSPPNIPVENNGNIASENPSNPHATSTYSDGNASHVSSTSINSRDLGSQKAVPALKQKKTSRVYAVIGVLAFAYLLWVFAVEIRKGLSFST